jgi:hypothetical protein
MVIAPTTTNFDLSRVTYFKDKGTQIDQAKAQAVDQLSHAEMLTVVTGFIDRLIQSGVDKLEADTANGSNAEAQANLDKYRTDTTTTVASFKGEVADKLAQNIYAVKHLLIKDELANPNGEEMTFKHKDGAWGKDIVSESAQKLAEHTLASIHTKLSAYGITVNAGEATKLEQVIIGELKKPPKPKSETVITETPPIIDGASNTTTASTVTTETEGTQTSNEPAVSTKELLTQLNEFIQPISDLAPVKALLKQDNGLKTLTKLNQDLADLNPNIQDESTLRAALEKALKALDDRAHSYNANFINQYLTDPEQFKEKFSDLDDNHKLQIQITLKGIEEKAQQTKTINNIVSSIVEIKEGLGGDRLTTLLKDLSSVNKGYTTPSKENHLDTIDNLLEVFKKDLEPASTARREDSIAIRDEATKAFIEKLNTGLKDGSLSNADIKLIAQRLEKPNQEGDSGKSAKEIAEQVLENSIKNLNISKTELQKFGGLAVAAVVGLMIFCPNAIGNLFKGGAGLVAMAAPQITPLLAAKMMMRTNQPDVNATQLTQLTQILEKVGIKNK